LFLFLGPGEALSHLEWLQAMIDQMFGFQSSGTWESIPFLTFKSIVECQWFYTLKTRPDGKIDHYRARPIAKGYVQSYGQDYTNMFSPIATMKSIQFPFSIVAICYWTLFQLDIKNAFLHGDLDEEVYMN